MARIGSFLFILFFSPVTFAQICVDSDPVGDGWGWNGTSSCRVTEVPDEDPGDLASTCVDTDPLGDGWGWNGTASCRVGATPQQPTQQCIDTDPVGDGWGWNGIESCMVGAAPQPQPVPPTQQCIDTDPVGDGWGWNGIESCMVGAAPQPAPQPVPTQQCIDTPPVGDGWGWNGFESCRVDVQACTIDASNPPTIGMTIEGETLRKMVLEISLGDSKDHVFNVLGSPVEIFAGLSGNRDVLRYAVGAIVIDNETDTVIAVTDVEMPLDRTGLSNACPRGVVDTDNNPDDLATCHNNQACAIQPDNSYHWPSCSEFNAVMTDGLISTLVGANKQTVASQVGLPTTVWMTTGPRINWSYDTFTSSNVVVNINGQTGEVLRITANGVCQ